MPRQPQLTAPAVRLIRREYDAAKAAGRRPKLTPFARRYRMAKSAVWQVANWVSYKWVRE